MRAGTARDGRVDGQTVGGARGEPTTIRTSAGRSVSGNVIAVKATGTPTAMDCGSLTIVPPWNAEQVAQGWAPREVSAPQSGSVRWCQK